MTATPAARRFGAAVQRQRRVLVAGAMLLIAAAVTAAVVWRFWPQRAPHVSVQALLAQIARDEGTWDNPWDLQERKIAELRQEAALERDAMQRLILQREIAQQYVNGGTPEPAIALLEKLLADNAATLSRQDAETLKADIAFAYFRIGEQTNCQTGVDAEACLFPVNGDAVQRSKLGVAEAASRYAQLLADPAVEPDNALLYRWMLNLAQMQLGQYPQGVPERWRIDPKTFESNAAFPRFKEIAATRGLVEFGRAGGAILEDFDNDGHLDLLLSHMGTQDPLQYFHNDGHGHFTRATERAGLAGLPGGLNMVQADYDNDGCIDVYIPRGAWFHDHGRYPASLLHNNCDGTFTDVGVDAGVSNGFPSQVAVWADFNGDGLLDLFVGNEIMRDKVRWGPDTKDFRLYINQGDGRFVDVGAESGIRVTGMIKGATVDDYDNDGRPDLYVSVMGGANKLFRNLGGKLPHFADVTERAGVAEPRMSFTTWFFDVDNDGWPDLFVSGYSATVPNIVRELLGDKAGAKGERPRLYHNNRDGTFTDISQAMHVDQLLLTMGANYGDLDNDGWLDMYLGTGAAPPNYIVPNQMFRNAEGRGFENVTTAGGFGHLQKGHAVAFGDIDNTGVQDVVANIGGAMTGDKGYSVLFKNPGNDNHWIKLDLKGVRSNRYAIGARLHLQVRDAQGRPRSIYRTVGSGGSFGASPLRQHIGIGTATRVDRLEIRWPGATQWVAVAGALGADARYAITEGSTEARRLDAPRGPGTAPPAKLATLARP